MDHHTTHNTVLLTMNCLKASIPQEDSTHGHSTPNLLVDLDHSLRAQTTSEMVQDLSMDKVGHTKEGKDLAPTKVQELDQLWGSP